MPTASRPGFPYTVSIDVRLRDVDFMGHVNNAVYATYLEEARAAVYRDVVGDSLDDLDSVLASLSIDYERPIHAEDAVSIEIDRPELGESSVSMRSEITANGERAGLARSVQVFVDPADGTARPIPSDIRASFER